MTQIGNVNEIIEIKNYLEQMKLDGLIASWELPYENILTRREAAIFFLSPSSDDKLQEIWTRLNIFTGLRYMENENKKLSQLDFTVEFSQVNN